MHKLQEPQFHGLMAVLILLALALEQEGPRFMPGLTIPKVGIVTLAIGLCWLALFAAHRIRNLHERLDVLEERLRRTTQRTDALEDDARARRGLPLRGS